MADRLASSVGSATALSSSRSCSKTRNRDLALPERRVLVSRGDADRVVAGGLRLVEHARDVIALPHEVDLVRRLVGQRDLGRELGIGQRRRPGAIGAGRELHAAAAARSGARPA